MISTTSTAPATAPVIRTQGLTKQFTSRKQTVDAVRGLDLRVDEGELVALLGPNGAGKSTTLRMLTTLLPPTAGTAQVAGFDITRQRSAVRARIGYIGQGNGAGQSQRGRDELLSQGRCYGMSRAATAARADELIASLDLTGVADRKVSTMSGGQRRRLDIALGLVHSPRLLFLDEPSTGLDPQNRVNLQEHVRALRARHGTTVVLTTHYLDEADALAERVIIIDHGQLIADDTPAGLKARHADSELVLAFDDAADAQRAADRLRQHVPDRPARIEPVPDPSGARRPPGAQVVLRAADAPRLLPRLLRDLEEAGLAPAAATAASPTLDDVFLSLTGRSLRDAGGAESADADAADANAKETPA
ncbi:ATP-binding cassette domain-containing protein [Frankia sp. CNm7]|uniref:ATP-binding cassette domain-containing protein n=1 Tax=Frankia nepalensis TaxID=1836974 RepID=A0A937US60_9ACTN|nr:ATP-binding cassette domain-containing protein [Frankia nepalensis]MBL7500787.1 ATP-binding cassette domain-containing protein [Frankia nepalensis]MBL7512594.1 ATP-binding cassette domain-containing protein [Frankia nepalensis]MBL7519515.1 ATP-binding cassette domain-containing protein [Frankia nepalensis]MBL7633524.1 ATP-binding cassette domain-containing protein [Frankia nepalensis]